MLNALVQFFSRVAAGHQDLSLSEWGALRVSQQQLENEEECRAGQRFFLGIKNGITGIAPVQAVPTTSAQWAIWNSDGYKSIIVDELGALLVSGTAGAGIVVLATFFGTPSQDAVAMNTGISIVQANGNNSGNAYSSIARVVSAVTITAPAAPIWFPIAENYSTNTAILSVDAINRFIAGKLIIPPKMGLGLAVTSPAGTSPLYAPYAAWSEKVISNNS